MGTYGENIQSAMAAQIKAEMAARDWKQPNLADATGIPTSTLHRYLSGARDIPLPVFAEIAKALDLSVMELAGRAQRRLDGENVQ
ncbi:transcriptional repressor [Arthrobacter phage Shoya]|uniref:Immunity repressor n=1 Tax=Arthrobacter phage Shoya TaxID=2704035 RepID=A0A6G6XIX2_9CAUD|nr:transcriptional repressor [Arthrobacter phage Shoya]QIG57710.1 immunity repressor [Arthrobacter phage Shoya]